MMRNRIVRTPGSRDERGSTLPLVALAIVTLMACAALTIDIGSLAATNRRLQAVADLGALAGSNELIGAACNHTYTLGSESSASTVFNHVREAVVKNAIKNSFTVGGEKTLVVEVGTVAYVAGAPAFTPIHSSASPGDCTSASIPTAVRVTASDRTTYGFGSVIGREGRTTSRDGVASRKSDGSSQVGGFTIGSKLANFNSTNSPLMNSILKGMVCPTGSPASCNVNASVLGYEGLATANVTLNQLKTHIGTGSVNSLLNTEVTMGQFYLASAKALGCTVVAGCSNTAAVTLLGLATSVNSTVKFKLRDLITVAAGGETAAAATSFNVLSLVTGSAQVLNGTNTVSIPNIGITIPNVSSTSLSLKVTELPRTYIGPVGGSVSTSQVELTITQNLNLLNVPIVGSLLGSLASITGSLPVKVTAGSATGTLTEVRCGSDKGETVSVDTKGAALTYGDTNTANKFLSVKVANILGIGIEVATLNVNGSAGVAGVSGNTLSFDYPGEYLPASSAPTPVGGTTLNVAGSASLASQLQAVLGLVTLDASTLTTALVGSTGALGVLDTAVVSPILRALGVTVGGADVWAIGAPGCGAPNIAG